MNNIYAESNFPDGTVLVGGHGRWQKFFSECHPNVKIISGNNVNFPKNIVTDRTPLVLINASHMTHCCWWRLKPLLKKAKAVKYIGTRGRG